MNDYSDIVSTVHVVNNNVCMAFCEYFRKYVCVAFCEYIRKYVWLFANIFAKTKYFAKPFMSVHGAQVSFFCQ